MSGSEAGKGATVQDLDAKQKAAAPEDFRAGEGHHQTSKYSSISRKGVKG